jgi:hypothetical protein
MSSPEVYGSARGSPITEIRPCLANSLPLQLAFDCSAAPISVRVGAPTREKENQMKTLTIVIAIALIAFTARASEPVPYIAMPIDNGYAIDSHGKRQPNALCARDVVWACPPRYPIQSHSIDPTTWSRNHRGDGLYRLDINLKTGRVSRSDLLTDTPANFAIGTRNSKIANIAVPVVQRIEQGFPNPAGFPSHEGSGAS